MSPRIILTPNGYVVKIGNREIPVEDYSEALDTIREHDLKKVISG